MTDFVEINRALQFASVAHRDQVRKYSKIPYITHPVELMLLLQHFGCTDTAMLIAALLHDVIEDCGITREQIEAEFGSDVADLVCDLTDDKIEGNRAHRKAHEVVRISGISVRAKTVKCVDLISNTRDIAEHDQNFAKVYLKEKRAVLEVLDGADPVILRAAWLVLEEAERYVLQSQKEM